MYKRVSFNVKISIRHFVSSLFSLIFFLIVLFILMSYATIDSTGWKFLYFCQMYCQSYRFSNYELFFCLNRLFKYYDESSHQHYFNSSWLIILIEFDVIDQTIFTVGPHMAGYQLTCYDISRLELQTTRLSYSGKRNKLTNNFY